MHSLKADLVLKTSETEKGKFIQTIRSPLSAYIFETTWQTQGTNSLEVNSNSYSKSTMYTILYLHIQLTFHS